MKAGPTPRPDSTFESVLRANTTYGGILRTRVSAAQTALSLQIPVETSVGPDNTSSRPPESTHCSLCSPLSVLHQTTLLSLFAGKNGAKLRTRLPEG